MRAKGRTLGDLLYTEGTTPPSEQEWVKLLQAIGEGDQDALQAIYHRVHRLVFTIALRIANNPETAEEVTVDVFHDVWRRASTYDAAGGTVIGWIMNQARSRAIDRVRFEQRKKRVAGEPESVPDAHTDDPQRALVEHERGLLLRRAVALLTSAERQVIETAFFSGLSYADAANRLELPVGTVKTRIRSALSKLRQALGSKREAL